MLDAWNLVLAWILFSTVTFASCDYVLWADFFGGDKRKPVERTLPLQKQCQTGQVKMKREPYFHFFPYIHTYVRTLIRVYFKLPASHTSDVSRHAPETRQTTAVQRDAQTYF